MGVLAHRLRTIRFAGILSLVIALLIAAEVAWERALATTAAREHARVESILRLRAARQRLESYFDHIGVTLRSISLHDGVRALSDDVRPYVEAIYETNFARHQLAEVYIVERGFDGTTRPRMTFESDDPSVASGDLHIPEREAEEYAEQIRQLRRFEADPACAELLSRPVKLCVGGRGLVFAFPIRDGARLVGSVAGMIPSAMIAEHMRTSGFEARLALLDDLGQVVATSGMDAADQSRLEMLLGQRAPFDAGQAASAAGSGMPALLESHVRLPGVSGWRLALLPDLPGRGASLVERFSDWWPPVLIVVLGVSVFVLCRLVPQLVVARREAEAGRQRLAELAHLGRLVTAGEMTIGLAHELNQPLAAISTYAHACLERLADARSDATDLRRDLDQIANQAERAGLVVSFLRRFVRRKPGERATVRLGDLIEQTLVLARAELQAGAIDIELDLSDSLPPVFVEEVAVQQVLMNLIRNAIDALVTHALAGQRTLRIRTWLDAPGVVACEVIDRGAVLQDSDIERMFTPFYTTKADGLGMGLAISRTIVEAHGGRLWGRAGAERGAIFGFSLPTAGAT